jgi:hypothetical protein
MSERYLFTSRDKSLIEAGILLLRKLATAPMTKPGQLKTVTKVLEALLRLPKVPRGLDVSIMITSDAISVFSTSWRTRLVVSKSAKELERALSNWYLGLVWGWTVTGVARERALSRVWTPQRRDWHGFTDTMHNSD